MSIKVGEDAKSFKIDDQDSKPISLPRFNRKFSSPSTRLHGQVSVLSRCHRLKRTGVVSRSLRVPMGISVDSAPCKLAWAKSLNITRTRLLADFWPLGAVAKMYGLFNDAEGVSKRANVLINEDCKIAFIKVYPIGKLPYIEEIIGCVKSLQQGSK